MGTEACSCVTSHLPSLSILSPRTRAMFGRVQESNVNAPRGRRLFVSVMALATCGCAPDSDVESAPRSNQPAPEPATEPNASEPLSAACLDGFWPDGGSDEKCTLVVPNRGGLCFASGTAACACACGKTVESAAACNVAYSFPAQVFCGGG